MNTTYVLEQEDKQAIKNYFAGFHLYPEILWFHVNNAPDNLSNHDNIEFGKQVLNTINNVDLYTVTWCSFTDVISFVSYFENTVLELKNSRKWIREIEAYERKLKIQNLMNIME